jgi:hypothetical protein
MFTYKTNIGNAEITFQENDFKTICKVGDLLGSMPRQCTLCGSGDIHLFHKNPQENDYYGLRCKCGAEFNFHQRKKGGFYITAGDKFEIYNAQNKTPTETEAPRQQKFEDDKIPF